MSNRGSGGAGAPVDQANDPIRQITLRAWARNRQRADTLAEISAEVGRTGTLPTEQRDRARSVAHALTGSAGTFGHPEVSATARRIEHLLDADHVLSESGRAELRTLVETACAGLRREPAPS